MSPEAQLKEAARAYMRQLHGSDVDTFTLQVRRDDRGTTTVFVRAMSFAASKNAQQDPRMEG